MLLLQSGAIYLSSDFCYAFLSVLQGRKELLPRPNCGGKFLRSDLQNLAEERQTCSVPSERAAVIIFVPLVPFCRPVYLRVWELQMKVAAATVGIGMLVCPLCRITPLTRSGFGTNTG